MADYMNSRKKRAAVYCRVSTAGQEEDGTSLDTQELRCREFAEQRGYELIGVFRDAYSGSKYRERPQLNELRRLVREQSIDVLVAYSIDRLSRNQAHLYILAEEVEDHGAKLEFVTEDFEDSATGRFLRSAKAFAGEIEREKIIERVTRTRKHRVTSGKLLPGGRPRYGYQWRDDTRSAYDIDPITGPIVQRMFREARDGKTLRAIAGNLTADGVPTPSGKPRWSHPSVRDVLTERRYTGDAYGYGWVVDKTNGGNKRRWDQDKAIQLPDGTIPALIDLETFEAVQARLTKNKAEASRNNKEPKAALLRAGYCRCGYCGRSMTVKRYSSGRLYYRCPGDAQQHDPCPHPTISVRKTDAEVWEHLKARILDPDIFEQEILALQDDGGATSDVESVDRAIAKSEREKQNLVTAIANVTNPQAMDALTDRINQLGERIEALQRDREEIVQQGENHARLLTQMNSLRDWCQHLAERVEQMTYEQKRLAIEGFGIEVRVYKKWHEPRYELKARVPMKDTSIVDTYQSSSSQATSGHSSSSRRSLLLPESCRRQE
jgi:site-specific DNA recombinase